MSLGIVRVLNHGFVELVDHMGTDLDISRSARVDPDASWREPPAKPNDRGLIDYMWNNYHTSPFEHVVFKFHVKAPIFVFRQWHRHRTWSYNEISARYSELPNEYYIPETFNFGTQSAKNHQSMNIDEELENAQLFHSAMIAHCESAFQVYHHMLSGGVPREVARMVLPVNVYSRMIATVNLRNLLHFLFLRDDEHAQYEMQLYAKALRNLIRPLVPVALDSFERQVSEMKK